jgi:hypothetical protein
MSFIVTNFTLSADLAASGTTTVTYPTGTDEDTFVAWGHKAQAIGNDLVSPDDFTLTFGSASITFTYAASKTTIVAGEQIRLQLNLPGPDDKIARVEPVSSFGVQELKLVKVNLGSPLVADTNYFAAAQTPTATGALTMTTTTSVLTGAGSAPYGRNITIDGSAANTAVLTVSGTDWQGNTMSEAITFNGTTVVNGVKAFGTVTGASISATNTGTVVVGYGDVLGLPFYVDGVDDWVTELEDGVTATAGTFVAGVDTLATTTTGDVRGTYDPNSATDGAKNFVLYLASPDPNYHGVTQA